jgi:hypothetical protein
MAWGMDLRDQAARLPGLTLHTLKLCVADSQSISFNSQLTILSRETMKSNAVLHKYEMRRLAANEL